jgi:hypothetical protein
MAAYDASRRYAMPETRLFARRATQALIAAAVLLGLALRLAAFNASQWPGKVRFIT